jgi:hypothetical protein
MHKVDATSSGTPRADERPQGARRGSPATMPPPLKRAAEDPGYRCGETPPDHPPCGWRLAGVEVPDAREARGSGMMREGCRPMRAASRRDRRPRFPTAARGRWRVAAVRRRRSPAAATGRQLGTRQHRLPYAFPGPCRAPRRRLAHPTEIGARSRGAGRANLPPVSQSNLRPGSGAARSAPPTGASSPGATTARILVRRALAPRPR